MIPSSLSPSSSLESYGDELIAATRAYAAVANARTGDDAVAVADAANATREDVLAACARVDAEGTKGTKRSKVFLARRSLTSSLCVFVRRSWFIFLLADAS